MDIKIDRRNYRKHGDRNKELINKSISELGAGRSILIDNENEIIAGNGVFEQAKGLNIPIKVIETDGSELIALKRTDLQTDDKKRKQLAIMDNSTNDHSDWDYEALKEDYYQSDLIEFGVDLDEINFNIPNVLGHLEDGAFKEKFENESDIFSVTFNFPKDKETEFLKKIKDVGKDIVAQEIMNFLGVE